MASKANTNATTLIDKDMHRYNGPEQQTKNVGLIVKNRQTKTTAARRTNRKTTIMMVQSFFVTILLSLVGSQTSYVSAFAPPAQISATGSTPFRQTASSSGGSKTILSMSSEPKKETTWDRITGPKLFKTVTNWEGIHSVPLVPLRVMVGLLMIHHGSEGTMRDLV